MDSKQRKNEHADLKKCMICLMDYTEEKIVRTLPYIHYFHCECIGFWLAIAANVQFVKLDVTNI